MEPLLENINHDGERSINHHRFTSSSSFDVNDAPIDSDHQVSFQIIHTILSKLITHNNYSCTIWFLRKSKIHLLDKY